MHGRAPQRDLPFAEAEASRAELRGLLGRAVALVGGDLYLRELVLWIHNATSGGPAAELVRSYRELAASPWGLCCSVSKARATVEKARRLGLLAVTENRYTSGGQRANGYTIDLPRVRSIVRCGAGASTEQGAALTEHPPASREQGGASTRQPYKEQLPSLSPLLSAGPDRRAAAGPEVLERTEVTPGGAAAFGHVPELRDALGRVVEPLPAKSLVYGVYKPVTKRHLGEPEAMIQWHRRQLSTPRPPVPGTEADLLLVLAAAEHALQIPAAELRCNHVAVWVSTIARGRWVNVLDRVPAARKALDAQILRSGAALLTGPWPSD